MKYKEDFDNARLINAIDFIVSFFCSLSTMDRTLYRILLNMPRRNKQF